MKEAFQNQIVLSHLSFQKSDISVQISFTSNIISVLKSLVDVILLNLSLSRKVSSKCYLKEKLFLCERKTTEK